MKKVERWTCEGPDECAAPCVELVRASDYDALELRLTAALGIGWQPIETAPWDGTAVLLWRESDKCHYIAARVRGEHGPGWCTPNGHEIFRPTHWQPLAAAPASPEP